MVKPEGSNEPGYKAIYDKEMDIKIISQFEIIRCQEIEMEMLLKENNNFTLKDKGS